MEAGQGRQDEDPERKKKKEEKAREKELKKQKAAQKAEAAKAAKAAPDGPGKKKDAKAKRPAEEVADPPTPAGQKKQLAALMAPSYSPKAVERSWYEWWEESGFFVADNTSTKPPFVIVVPPPNVTGALHIGHALTAAIQDSVVRWHRMRGYNTLWVPGMDHAGIATQVVVEKKIMRESNLTRHDIGREKFEAKVWEWKKQYGDTISRQQRKVGASLDWSRECFTMDDKLSNAVTEAFVRLYDEGLIYRDDRLVNWDCTLKTAISDIEVEYKELEKRDAIKVPGYDERVEFGIITSFAYPLEGGTGEIVVATTRPETMLGDTAVAVHPNDDRYRHLHGKFLIHPFNGRRIPIILDAELVDMAFGTGAVKITPAHDPNDYEVGKRHNLEFINIFTDDGKINSSGGQEFEGLKRFDARMKVLKALESKGLYRGVADNPMKLGICSRSNDVVEPLVKPQWYVDCQQMATDASNAVKEGKLKILPKLFEDTWHAWLRNIRPWCISRQLWWGHRVPAWYAHFDDDELEGIGSYDDHWIVGRNETEANAIANKKFAGKKFRLEQDPDVLDTWFSSGLFPFSVMGWPEETADMRTFYPTSLLETGHDILFFWVARMVMMGMKLTNEVPFKHVFLHAIVRDAQGRKMSKSLGNVIDPLEVISGITLEGLQSKLTQGNLEQAEVERASKNLVADYPNGIIECGADALRFALVSYTMQPMKINLDIQRVVGYRQWCNKLWNAIRFALMKLGTDFAPSKSIDVASLPFSCKWILSVLNNTISKTNEAFASYDLTEATTAIYSWWQYQLCDVFIEVIKPALSSNSDEADAVATKAAVKDTLWICLDTGLRLLHPLMPFITEELWQRLPRKDPVSSIMVAEYPSAHEHWSNLKVETQMGLTESIVRSARGLRMANGLQTTQREEAELFVVSKDSAISADIVSHGVPVISTLASVSVKVLEDSDQPPAGCAVAIVNANVSVYLLVKGRVNAGLEIAKLKKRKDELLRQQEALTAAMSSSGYAKAPACVQAENNAKLAELATELGIVEEATCNFQALVI